MMEMAFKAQNRCFGISCVYILGNWVTWSPTVAPTSGAGISTSVHVHNLKVNTSDGGSKAKPTQHVELVWCNSSNTKMKQTEEMTKTDEEIWIQSRPEKSEQNEEQNHCGKSIYKRWKKCILRPNTSWSNGEEKKESVSVWEGQQQGGRGQLPAIKPPLLGGILNLHLALNWMEPLWWVGCETQREGIIWEERTSVWVLKTLRGVS